MTATTIPLSRGRPEDEDMLATATTTGRHDPLGFAQTELSGAYTQIVGVVVTAPPLQPRRALKYVFGRTRALPGFLQAIPFFEASEDDAASPGATVFSVADSSEMWPHPENLKTAHNIANLVAQFSNAEQEDWNSFVEAFAFFRRGNKSPREKFETLVEKWRGEVRLLSDSNEACTHPAYQQIIGMGAAALPFIFELLGKELDHWFWALKAITGEDPVPEDHRGNLDLMAQDWLVWNDQRIKPQTLGWRKVFATEWEV